MTLTAWLSRVLSVVRTALHGAPAPPTPTAPRSRTDLPIIGPKQARYLVALARVRAAGKLARGEWPRDNEHFKTLFRSLTPDERAWPQSANAQETLPKQTPAEVEKILALFPDDGSKVN